MFRGAFWPLSSLHSTRSLRTARYFHQVTTYFVTHDARGNLVTRKVPIIIGNPGETYVLIETGIGSALRAASPLHFLPRLVLKIDANLHFFMIHNTLGLVSCQREVYIADANSLLGTSSYSRLYIPSQLPRQTESNESPATLLLDGVMHEIVLDGTFDGTYNPATNTSRLTHAHL